MVCSRVYRVPGVQARAFGEPADHRVDLGAHERSVVGPAQHVPPAADVTFVLEFDAHGGVGERVLERFTTGTQMRLTRVRIRRQSHHLVARLEHPPAGDGARVTTEVGVGPDDVLDRHARIDEVVIGTDVHLFEVVQQRGPPLVPRHVRGAADDVVALQRRDRHEAQVVDLQFRCETPEFVADLVEALLRPVHQIHLVDAQHQVRHAEQARQERVTAGLLQDSLAGVDENERQIGGRGAGDHVAGVLLVAGGVSAMTKLRCGVAK